MPRQRYDITLLDNGLFRVFDYRTSAQTLLNADRSHRHGLTLPADFFQATSWFWTLVSFATTPNQ